MKLNEKILYYRKRSGLSQEALAEKLGVSRQAVSKWETGDATPEISNLLLMAKTFGVTTDHLLSEDEPEASPSETEKPREDAPHDRKKNLLEGASKGVGMISRLVKRFGWLAGIYVAFSGVPFLLVGFVMRAFAKSSFDFIETVSGTGTNFLITDGFGNTYSSANEAMLSDPFMIISAVVIGIGVITVLFGVFLAVYLRLKYKK